MQADLVFLDVGGVILEIDWKRTLEPIGISDPAAQKRILSRICDWEVLDQFERGRMLPEQFFAHLRTLLDVHEDVESLWNKLIVGPLPGAEVIFDRFRGKVPICALSNTNVSHHVFIRSRFPILERFDRFLASYELGHRKPDPEIYLAAAEIVNVRPDRILFIDDSLVNVKAAKRVGFKAFQTVNSTEHTVRVLAEGLGI